MTHTEVFDSQYPSYIAMGMTYEEYWLMDPYLTRAYRKADEIRQQRTNEQAWLQGAYIYDVMTRLFSIYNPFAKHPKAMPYMEKPYELKAKEEAQVEDLTSTELDRKVEESRDAFMAIMLKHNKDKAKAKGGGTDGGS